MEIIQVAGKNTVKEFHDLAEKIYKDDPNYIPSLRVMVEDVFNPDKNAKYKIGDARRWILKRKNKCIGRIAAFYDEDYSSGYDQPTGGCGFFECVDDQQAAELLFDTAKDWLQSNGMKAMDGP